MGKTLFDLTGSRILITGSGQGIGFGLAEGLGCHGAEIILNGRTVVKLERAAEALAKQGIRVSVSAFDVTDHAKAAQAVDNIETEIGPIDVLINNAGMQYRAPLEDFPADKWDEMLRTNVSSIFNVGQATAKHMIRRGRGRIINIASVMSELARPTIAPYTAAKGAVRNLTRGMCADWAKHGLQVNAIAPGYFKTELNRALVENPEFTGWLEKRTPAGRWGNVEELVGAAVFLASDAASFVNGHTLYVDGGITTSV